jgi:periplasmic protein TonB
MTPASSFLDRPQARSPTSLTAVILLHAGVIAAVLAIKNPVFDPPNRGPTIVASIPLPTPPEPPEPDPAPPQPRENPRSILDAPDSIIRPPVPPVPSPPTPPGPANFSDGRDIAPPVGDGGSRPAPLPPPPMPAPTPVRTTAEFDPRFARDQQPDYPLSEQRADREGVVRVRVTISAAGRVTAVTRLSATSDAFWRATERHALARWRFRPATVDGRPVESSKVMSVFFRLDD